MSPIYFFLYNNFLINKSDYGASKSVFTLDHNSVISYFDYSYSSDYRIYI
nr:MAG TPA: hypothetical protein [Caudoviricetes sp.]